MNSHFFTVVPPTRSAILTENTPQVMLLKNLDSKRGLVNGARGVVTGFECVGADDSEPEWRQVCGPDGLWPVVQFARGITQTITPERWVSTLRISFCCNASVVVQALSLCMNMLAQLAHRAAEQGRRRTDTGPSLAGLGIDRP